MITTLLKTKETHLEQVVATVAALAAIGGGLIHFSVVGDHLEFPIVAAGFAAMGILQWAFAWRTLTRPSRALLLIGGLLHAIIAGLWIVSRTLGIAFFTGAQEPAAVGVSDLAANTFSVAVVGAAFLGLGLSRSVPVVLPPSIAKRLTSVALGLVTFLTVPALLAPHSHSHSEPHLSETTHDHGTTLGS